MKLFLGKHYKCIQKVIQIWLLNVFDCDGTYRWTFLDLLSWEWWLMHEQITLKRSESKEQLVLFGLETKLFICLRWTLIFKRWKCHEMEPFVVIANLIFSLLGMAAIRKKLVIVGRWSVWEDLSPHSVQQRQFPEVYVPTVFENYIADIEVDSKQVGIDSWPPTPHNSSQQYFQSLWFGLVFIIFDCESQAEICQ